MNLLFVVEIVSRLCNFPDSAPDVVKTRASIHPSLYKYTQTYKTIFRFSCYLPLFTNTTNIGHQEDE
jgi:hypothetical protein